MVFRPLARLDLIAIHDFIAEAAGPTTAGRYLDRIEAACCALARFPERGARRDDLAPGVRTLGFERRAIIAFRIAAGEVEILRILYGGRDIEAAFEP